MEVIWETLWKRCLSTPIKPPAKNSNICLSETAYQHKGTRKKLQENKSSRHNSVTAAVPWTNHIASPDRSRKQATFLSRVPVHCITPFCWDALVSPPNLYPPCSKQMNLRSFKLNRVYLDPLNVSNAGDFSWSWIRKDFIQVHKEDVKFVVVCPRPA